MAKWWSPVQVKSVSKGKQKQDISIEPLDSTNIIRFTKFMHKFATSLNEWVLFGKTGLSKQKFSESFSLMTHHLRTLLSTEEKTFNLIHLKDALKIISSLLVLTALVVTNSSEVQENQLELNL